MVTRIKPSKHQVKSVYTLFFWNTCEKCKRDFRREHGFKGVITPPSNKIVNFKYLCKACGVNMEQANDFFEEKRKEFMNYRPPRNE